jgi:ribosomal protein S10
MDYSSLSVSDKIAFLSFVAQAAAIRRPLDSVDPQDTENIIIAIRELAEKYAKHIDGPIP